MWLISLLAVIVCSYFLAKMTANLLALKFEGSRSAPSVRLSAPQGPVAPKEATTIEQFAAIAERNIFNSKSTGAEAPASAEEAAPAEQEPVNPTGEAVATSLKIKLLSTFSFGAGTDDRSSAIISTGSGESGIDVYTVNDKKVFAPETKIVKIRFDRVEFIHRGRLEYISLEDFAQGGQQLNTPPTRDTPPPAAAANPAEPRIEKKEEGNFVIDKAEIEDAVANLDKLYTQIRAVPHFKDGNPNGLKLLSVRSGSIFSKLGLMRGDILQKINGTELDMKKGLELFNQLRSESHITIEIERRGSVKIQEYDIR